MAREMLKRQDSLQLSSSSRRETPPPQTQNHHVKAVGCMPSILNIIFKYHKKNKRLTSGKKKEKSEASSSKKQKDQVITQTSHKNPIDTKRLSCDVVPRSPTLSAEFRNYSNATDEPVSHTARLTLVARLMGLEEKPKSVLGPTQQVEEESSTEEKKKKLLRALEKCNEDLEELKNVINAVQSGDKIVHPPSVVKNVQDTCKQQQQQQLSTYSKGNTNGQETQQRKPTPKKNPRDADNIDTCFFRKTVMESCQIKRETTYSSPWSSKPMIKSVDEVCKDIAWGEQREVGRIGLMLQDYICRELIEEAVKELATYHLYPLPFEACKRRLCF